MSFDFTPGFTATVVLIYGTENMKQSVVRTDFAFTAFWTYPKYLYSFLIRNYNVPKFTRTFISLIKQYMTGRVLLKLVQPTVFFHACVRVNGEISDVFNCRMGAQGDTMSPLLFIIYIIDLKIFIRCKFSGIELYSQNLV